LVALAHAIEPLGGTLRVYQSIDVSIFRRDGLRTSNIETIPFMPADRLHRDLVDNADAMYLPMSYAAEDRDNVELCFPSKLTDYTVTGLPILVHCPSYGTAAEWVRENPAAADLVTSTDPGELTKAAARLMSDDTHWQALGRAALAARNGMFSHEQNYRQLIDCLLSASGKQKRAEAVNA
jgi:glycosyltransferase involved in cell wall biosynthesis